MDLVSKHYPSKISPTHPRRGLTERYRIRHAQDAIALFMSNSAMKRKISVCQAIMYCVV